MWVFNAALPDGSKVTDAECWFRSCALHAESSLNLLVILWIVKSINLASCFDHGTITC